MSTNSTLFAKQTSSEQPNAFMAKLMRQKGMASQSNTLGSQSNTLGSQSNTSNFLERLRASKAQGDQTTKLVEPIEQIEQIKASNSFQTKINKTMSSDEYMKRLAQSRITNEQTRNYSSVLTSSTNTIGSITESKQTISHEEYIEQMRQKRLQPSSETNKITTFTYDLRNGNDVAPIITEKYMTDVKEPDYESDDKSSESSKLDLQEEVKLIDISELVYSVKYMYGKNETLKSTPAISKDNMINFLSKQGANGGFNPVEAYNNTLSDSDRAQLKEETIRKNIGAVIEDSDISNISENQQIIEELGARRNLLTKSERKKLDQAEKDERARKKTEKEVNKAIKGPSKKILDMISKNKSNKVEKVLSDDELHLEKLEKEVRADRIKTVYDAGNWITIISDSDNKMKGFELLFMGVSDIVLKKIIFIEVMRRTPILDIKTKKFREAMTKFATTFPTDKMVKFQLEHMEDIIPPFSPFEKAKLRLDDWQIDVFKNINAKKSILIDAPTASGKTICATYCVNVCQRVIFVLPSKELANQVAGVIRNMKTPTTTYTPIKLITGENIYEDNNPKVFIGTAVDLERYFNLEGAQRIKRDDNGECDEEYGGVQFDISSFDYIIIDEIHQMNSPEQGCAMQRLIKRFKCPMLGLSATIGNPEQLRSWIEYLKKTTPFIDVVRVSYNKRFINQQKHVWNGNELVPIHPLAVITLSDLQDGKLIRTEMQFIPKDLFMLYSKMEALYPREAIQSIIPENFFTNACIGLTECKNYETVIKTTLTDLSQQYPEQTQTLLDHFLINDINLDLLGPKELYRVLKQMQNSKKLPAIIFKFDPTTCSQVAHKLLEWMEIEEYTKYPHYRELRELHSKHYIDMKHKLAAIDKIDLGKTEDAKSDKLECEMKLKDDCLKAYIDEYKKLLGHNVKKYIAEFEEGNATPERQSYLEFYIKYYGKELENVNSTKELRDVNIFAPHPEFTFSNVSICMSTMVEIKKLLKEYTDQITEQNTMLRKSKKKSLTNNFNIGYNHFFLKSIERGFVLYLNTLPVPFQRIAQMLIADGGAPITFSDESLAFGVNYPIRSVGLLGSTNNDIIDKAKADQASGRSGRRGLDIKGHTIYIGVNWKELTSSEYIHVRGANPDNEFMTLPYEFNSKFDLEHLSLVSLDEFCDITSANPDNLEVVQSERLQNLKDSNSSLVEKLGNQKNFMNVYRLSEYGILSEILPDFLAFLSSKIYSGVSIDRYDLFEMIGTIVDNGHYEDLAFENDQTSELMYEFQAEMAEKGMMIELHGCNFLTKCYKKRLFDENVSLSMARLRHINEILRILYNLTQSAEKTNVWVDMLFKIFDDIKTQIFKNII